MGLTAGGGDAVATGDKQVGTSTHQGPAALAGAGWRSGGGDDRSAVGPVDQMAQLVPADTLHSGCVTHVGGFSSRAGTRAGNVCIL